MIANSEALQIRKDVPSGTIVLQRPERRNALSRALVSQIRQALEDFHQEKKVRAVILTGSDSVFCSGSDLHEIRETRELPNAQDIWYDDVTQFQSLIEYMLCFPKPLIAAVNGWVLGSGVALMLACDLVVASHQAQLALPESRRGLIPGISAPLLAFRLGASRTAGLVLSGAPVPATTALHAGLFHETTDDNLVWARSHELAHELAEGAPQSHQLSKQMLNQTIGEGLFTQLSIGSANTAAGRTTEAAIEGVDAFLEKRTPQWP